MAVARRLGYKYLWIDALCILQDDPEDWLQESTRMASVYHNASCTIAAHTAGDSEDGFLDATLEPVPTIQVRSKDGKGRYISKFTLASNFQDQVSKSFLTQRGWIFQERILSPRILHFVRHHIFFEDDSGIRADGLRGSGTPLLSSSADDKRTVHRSSYSSPYWYFLVEEYSSCSLTYDTDRLPAIAGLAKEFSQRNRVGRYMLGIWEMSLHLGLLWMVVGQTRSDFSSSASPDANMKAPPSWSWAHWKGRICYTETLSGSFMKSAIKIRGDQRGIQHSHGEFLGLVDNAESRGLALEGLLAELREVRATTSLKPVGSPYFDPPMAGLCSLKTSKGPLGTWVALDGRQAGAHYFLKLSCLLVCRKTVTENDAAYHGVTHHYFLLLDEIHGQPGKYTRVGVGVTMTDIWTEKQSLIIL